MDQLAQAKEHFLTALEFQQRGELVQAEHCYRKALAIAPNRPSVMINLTAVLIETGKYEEAKSLSEKLLDIDPENPAALLNLGNCQLKFDTANAALISIEKALRIKPDYAEALISRASALADLDRPEEALAGCEKALAMKPDCVEALVAQGIAMRRLRRHEGALIAFDQALRLRPNSFGALTGRSNVLLDLNRFEEALAWSKKALELQPGDALALYNNGMILFGSGRSKEALDKLDAALSIRPDFAKALLNRGRILAELGRHEDASESYERALASKPDLDYALGALVHSRMHCCDWRLFGEDSERIVAGVRAARRTVDPFFCLGVSDSAKDQLLCSQIWVRDRFPVQPVSISQGKRYSHDRIRLAYLSSDLGDHPVSLLMAGVFELHDRAGFETTAISFGRDDAGEMRARLRGAFDRFIDVRHKGDREVASMIRDLEIDIAVDLNGFTKSARTNILALRAAPIQVNYLGYPGTLGAEYFDYILADRFVIPEQYIESYSEKVVRLPDCFQANDFRRAAAAEAPTRSEMGLPDKDLVFCCANNSYKITPTMFDVWMRILRGVPASCLWLVGEQQCVVSNLRNEASARGIDPGRLVFAKPAPYEQYLARYDLADLFLDTLPFNAGTTASDALWAGLPVLTCAGQAFAARMAGSLLHAVGLHELVTGSLEDYEALALQLARRPERLARLKRALVSNRDSHTLFDTDRFRQNLEKAYTVMWQRYQNGESPVSFDVDRI
jgi:predicted O-linked N-acetylglucosamine transferase (SPINDLY family)